MAMSMPILHNPPVRLYWAGWQTTTLDLQNNGWDLSVREDPHTDYVQIAIRHRALHAQGISDHVYKRDPVYHASNMTPFPLTANISLGSRITVAVVGRFPRETWKPVDAVPSFARAEEIALEDYCYFKSLPEHDVVVVPPSFDEILQMALDHQAPKQKELRAKARQRLGVVVRVAA
jgi:hypothetical protein